MTIFIDVGTLMNKISQKDNSLFIIDVRGKGTDTSLDVAEYEKGHIPNALYLHPKEDFTGKDSFFPESISLGEKLGELGISHDSSIVLYDDGKNRNVAKAWVTLHYIGHDYIYILQGGFQAWLHANQPICKKTPTYPSTIYKVKPRQDIVKSIDEMKVAIHDPKKVLIDSRAQERYTGEREPKYAKAGHIPGAKNHVAKEVFDEKGMWKSKEELQRHFSTLNDDEEIIVSCGTGNSACLNMIALIEAGFSNVNIYPGGYKEWIDRGYEIETGSR